MSDAPSVARPADDAGRGGVVRSPTPGELPQASTRLGATWDGEATTFAAWSGVATAVALCLFDAGGRETRVPMAHAGGGTWTVRVPGTGPGQRYGYRVDGPWDPSFTGPLCDPDRLLLDPWARAVSGEPDWHPALVALAPAGVSASRGGSVGRPAVASRAGRDTAPFVPRSIVVDPAFDWTGDAPPGRPLHDSVIYELHVRGFTRRHPGVPPPLRGTYAGLTHPAAIEHLVRLGVTAVELLPVQHFLSEPRLAALGLVNYWGYNPIAWLAPHAGHAADGSPGGAVHEFKSMVRALHAAGLEVILDVVFNHSAEGGRSGPILSLKGLDNAAFYRVGSAEPEAYEDLTACGNTLDARSPAVRRLVLDSLRGWVEEYHVDGFRFDLAGTLGRGAGGVFDPEHPLVAAIGADPVVGAVKLIAEPWDAGPGGYQAGRFPPPWSEWNDGFRDAARDLWRGTLADGAEVARRLAASPDRYRASGRPPTASVNFVAAHDGMTLADLVAYDRKRNHGNGEDGQDGADHDRSSNHGSEGVSDDPAVAAARLRTRRNLLATLFLAQGVPMLLAGDELGRTQGGNNNAYCQDNEISWLDWEAADPSFLAYVRGLIALRAARPALRQPDWLETDPVDPGALSGAEWQTLSGLPARPDGWPPEGGAGLVLRLSHAAAPHPASAPDHAAAPTGRRAPGLRHTPLERRTPGWSAQHCVVIQPLAGRRELRLPVAPGVAAWRIVLDTAAAEPFPEWGRALVPGRLEIVDGPSVLLLDGVGY